MIHEGKGESSVLAIEEEGVLWYYDIIKFLELGVYPNSANKRERRSIRMMAMQLSYVEDNSTRDLMMVFNFVAWRKKKSKNSRKKFIKGFVVLT